MDDEILDDVHDMLRERRRRYLLRSLYNQGPMQKKELAKYIAAAENKKNINEVEEDELKRVNISLHQSHLEPLDELDWVWWDEKTNRVSLGSKCHEVFQKIDGIELDDGPRWLADRL